MMPAFSTRNSTAPPFASPTAFFTSMVTVPTFGFGIRPRGPSTLPRRPTSAIMSGVAIRRSKSILPPLTVSNKSSAPTMSAPAALASSAFGPRANTATRPERPVPFGSETTPRTCWSGYFGSTPRFIAISTVSSNFALARALISFTASSSVCSLRESMPAWLFCWRLEILGITLLHHFHAHRAGGASDHLRGLVEISGVQILRLGFGDLLALRHGDLAHHVDARLLRAGARLLRRRQARGLLDQERRRGRLDLEGEALVLVVGNDDRARIALLHILRTRVKSLAEFHDVQTALTERGADRGRRIRRACRHLELDLPQNLLSHDVSSLFADRSSRTGLPEGCVVRAARPLHAGSAGL